MVKVLGRIRRAARMMAPARVARVMGSGRGVDAGAVAEADAVGVKVDRWTVVLVGLMDRHSMARARGQSDNPVRLGHQSCRMGMVNRVIRVSPDSRGIWNILVSSRR